MRRSSSRRCIRRRCCGCATKRSATRRSSASSRISRSSARRWSRDGGRGVRPRRGCIALGGRRTSRRIHYLADETVAESLMNILPRDADRATLVGRAWLPNEGPIAVTVQAGAVHDLSRVAPTVSQLLELDDPVTAIRRALREERAPRVAALDAVRDNSWEPTRNPAQPWFLAPCDLQAIKASGVTFVASLLERVIEEQARGDASRAESTRASLAAVLGDNLAGIVPGSEKAARVKEVLIAQGAWSQYLEVGIGPDAEIFTKAPVLAAVGAGSDVGIHPRSQWNNPEPEIVLAVNSRGATLGATLGNDVNLRDFEGRSALLLGKAKDNNASCAIGPFIRLFDDAYGIDDVRRCDIALRVSGPDGFELEGRSSLS